MVCASDLSWAELQSAFRYGPNSRGPRAPWAVVLDRAAVWAAGMRPVIYADPDIADKLAMICQQHLGPEWRSLVSPVRLSDPRRNDWLHEREWRYCFAAGPAANFSVRDSIRAVVVGRPGWNPGRLAVGMWEPVQRWLWTGTGLVLDGELQPTDGYWGAQM